LIEIWNRPSGVRLVKKFADRETAGRAGDPRGPGL
jgi:hypothetical protein